MKLKNVENHKNEVKGTLFEFFLAQKIALSNPAVLKKFHEAITPPLATLLRSYQQSMMTLDISLYEKLQELAQESAFFLQKKWKMKELTGVYLLGRTQEHEFGHADLLLVFNKEIKKPLSLKLAKKGSSIHCKNAGARSFLKEYWSLQQEQEEFNNFLNLSFEKFSRKLHDFYDIDYAPRFENWLQQGLPLYPGDLSPAAKEILTHHYYHLSCSLEKTLTKYFKKNSRNEVASKVLNLCGLDSACPATLIVNHTEHSYDGCHLLTREQFSKPQGHVKIISTAGTSFLIKHSPLTLRVRVKAMNRFVDPTPKINCSFTF